MIRSSKCSFPFPFKCCIPWSQELRCLFPSLVNVHHIETFQLKFLCLNKLCFHGIKNCSAIGFRTQWTNTVGFQLRVETTLSYPNKKTNSGGYFYRDTQYHLSQQNTISLLTKIKLRNKFPAPPLPDYTHQKQFALEARVVNAAETHYTFQRIPLLITTLL